LNRLPSADGARDKQVGQELHFQPLDALAPTFLAAAAGHIEAKAAGFEAKLTGLFVAAKTLRISSKAPV